MTPFAIGAAAVLVAHDERGDEQRVNARALELGDRGATLETARPMDCDTLAWVDFKAPRFSAIAHVSECVRHGTLFRIVVRFSWPCGESA